MAQETAAPYPLSLRGELDPSLTRWLWLVKWFLIVPHLVLLSLLWTAAIVVTVIATSERDLDWISRFCVFTLGIEVATPGEWGN